MRATRRSNWSWRLELRPMGSVKQTLGRFDYVHQGKAEKGLLRCFLAKVTGLSRAQLTSVVGPASGHREHRRPPRGAPTAVPPPLHEHRHRASRRARPAPRHLVRAGHAQALCARLPVALATAGSNAWPASPTATSTTCGTRPRINGAAEPPPPGRAQSRSPLASAVGRRRSGAPAMSGSIPSTKPIWMT